MRGRMTLLCALLAASCNQHPPTQVVVEVVSDLTDQIDSIQLCVTRNHDPSTQSCAPWGTGSFSLPASYGIYTDDGSEPAIAVTVTGYVGSNPPLERKSELSLIREHSLMLRLGLLKSCLGKTCPTGLTCIEGSCESPTTDPNLLPTFPEDPGTTATCVGSSIPAGPSAAPTCPDGTLCLEGGCVGPPTTPLSSASLAEPTSFVVTTDAIWVRTRGTAPAYADGTITRIDLVSLAITAPVTGLRSNLSHLGNGWLAATSGFLYFVDDDGLQLSRMPLTGASAVEPLGSALGNPITGLAAHADGSEIFYVSGGRLGVWRAAGGTQQDLADALAGSTPFVAADIVYWFDSGGTIQHMPFNGTTPAPLASHAFTDPREMVVTATSAYLTASAEDGTGHGAIWWLPLDASAAPTILSHPDKKPWGLALDGASAYFVDIDEGSVCAAPLGGGQVRYLSSASGSNGAIAVDAGYYYWATSGGYGNIMRVRK
jgi:hypothetical protein